MKNSENIIKLFSDGMLRVLKVVNSNPNYDAIIGEKKLSKPLYSELYADIKNKKYSLAADRLMLYIENIGLKVFKMPEGARVVFFGNTKNNIRELNRLKETFKGLPACDVVNVSRCEIVCIGVSEETLLLVRECVEKALEKIECNSLSAVRQLTLYLCYFFSFLETLTEGGVHLNRGIVSNDHSPIPVAFSMICRLFGMKRLYLQHAEITESFPHLDFEYAILHNENSKLIYDKIKKTSCETYIRENESGLSIDEVFESYESVLESNNVNVVIYPSSQFSTEKLSCLINVLNGNVYCDEIKIKFHPQHVVEEDFTNFAVPNIIEKPHVAIVGNSSVALELALRGNLVVLIDEIDSIAFDYYGFCNEGLIKTIDYSCLAKQRFWKLNENINKYQLAVRKRLQKKGGDDSNILYKIYVEFLLPSQYFIQSKDRLLVNISIYPNSFFYFERNIELSNEDAFIRIKDYERLFLDRIIPINDLYKYVSFERCASPDDFWILTKRIEWAGYKADQCELDMLVKYASNVYLLGDKYSKWIVSKLFMVCLRLESCSTMLDFSSNFIGFDLYKCGVNQKIAFLNFLNKHTGSACYEELKKIYTPSKDDYLSKIDTLKIKLLVRQTDHSSKILLDPIDVEEEYLRAIPESLKDEYTQYFLKFKSNYKDQCGFLNTRLQKDKKNDILSIIRESLLEETPFGMVRLSDGEGYLFPAFECDGLFSETDCLNRERHWWAQELPLSLRTRIREEGIKAINNCDIIGVPNIYRFLRDTNNKTKTYKNSVQGRGLLSVLSGVSQLMLKNKLFVDDKFNLELASDPLFYDILRSAKKIVVITSAHEKSFSGFFYKYNTEFLTIPTHSKQFSNEKFNADHNPLPYQLVNFTHKITKIVKPGTLVLIGAGIAGKEFVNTAKLSGGCAIDMGSALDELSNAGIHSLY